MASSRFLRAVLGVLLTLVALVALAYLGVNLATVVAADAHREELSAQLTQRLGDEVPALDGTLDEVTESVGAGPAHLWVVQECGIGRTEAGLLVQDYRQSCRLLSAAAWPVADRAAARELVRGVPGLRRLRRPESEGCLAVAHGPAGTASYVAPDRALTTPWCLEGMRPPEYRHYRPVKGSPASPDPSRGWLVVHRDQPLLDESIGCSRWSILFCGQPFGDELAWGTAPG